MSLAGICRWGLGGILAVISLLHLYWAFGGRWARDKTNPMVNGKPLLRITAVSCLSAAFLFFLLASVPFVPMKPLLRHWLLIAMMIVFAARAIGDFKYVGFFKSVKGTKFAIWDTRMYSPLNVVLSLLSGLSLR